MIAADFVNRLDGVRQTGAGRWIARCPAHDDRRPSLAIREVEDGRTLLHCFGGCATDSVLAAVGLTVSDLFPDRLDHLPAKASRFSPMDVLRCLGLELKVILLAGQAVGRGEALSKIDQLRVADAVRRVDAALELAGG